MYDFPSFCNFTHLSHCGHLHPLPHPFDLSQKDDSNHSQAIDFSPNRNEWSHLPLKKRPIWRPFEEESIKTYETYKCCECNKKFFNGVRYRAHLRRHESKRSGRYKCSVCDKTFVQRSSLTTHLRIHSGEKPFFCTECFDKFGDFSTFTKHKRIHSGEKPYSCPVCQRSFSQSGNMHRHLKAVHRPDSP